MLKALGMAAAFASGLPVGAAPAQGPVAAAPMRTSGALPIYPRLTAFPNAAVMAKVNSQLAAKEKDDRDTRADCYLQIRDDKQKIDRDSFSEDIRVTYLTRRFLSVMVVRNYDCAEPYPTTKADPVTFDLTTGVEVNWLTVFKPGFLPPDQITKKTPRSRLARLYWTRLPKADVDQDCREVLIESDPFGDDPPDIWMIAGRRLAVQPHFPHTLGACVVEADLPPADLAPYIKDANLAAELAAKPPPPRGAAGAKP
ncbi:MAG: hypothetical protein ACYDD1_08320 [Caulobacteraceae bacterium]